MKLPDFSKNDLELINVALKQAGKQYNNLFEPTTHLRLKIKKVIKNIDLNSVNQKELDLRL
jgi:hypothetical protein